MSAGAETGEKRSGAPSHEMNGASKPSAPAPSSDKSARKSRFEGVFPLIVQELVGYLKGEGMPSDAVEWYERVSIDVIGLYGTRELGPSMAVFAAWTFC